MARNFLSKDEIKELIKLLKVVFGFLKDLKQKNILAEKIQYPKIPSMLSESIISHLIKENKILKELKEVTKEVVFGGRTADLIVKIRPNSEFKIEVKSTGKSAFEYFGEKDIKANYLIWMHFDDFFIEETIEPIFVYVISNPAQYFKAPTKIVLSKLKDLVKESMEIFKLDIASF